LLHGNALAALRLRDAAPDGRLDQDVIRPPDHHEVLHIVASQEDEPALAVDVVGVDHAQARAFAPLRAVGKIEAARPHPPNDPKHDGGERDERDQPQPGADPQGAAAQIHDLLLAGGPAATDE
jgi:hypothetical protein